MTAQPFVSIVVPTYNRPESIRRCLQSLLTQTYPQERSEIIVIDDGGTVDLGSVVSRLDAVGQVRVLRQKNGGPATARNHGARQATGEFLAFTDDDCCPRPEWLSSLVDALVQCPGAMVGGRVVNGLAGNVLAQASQDLVSFLYGYFPEARALRPFLTTNNVAVHRKTFLEMGGFDECFRFSAGEDRDLSERWLRETGTLDFVDAAVVDHFHDLTLSRFIRQHHYYGRGAVTLARRRLARGEGAPSPEPLSFYARMLAYPFRGRSISQGITLGCLIALAQIAGLSGMAAESLRRNRSGRAHPRPSNRAS